MQGNYLYHLLSNWDDVVSGAGALFIISSAIRTMPDPPAGSVWYAWVYRFSQVVAANWDKAAKPMPEADAKPAKD